ncbi:MAG: hypothetical protein GXY87_04365 [Tissierellia bacterium]|nr:hypothetical protein [Tissierellia bacterium]
MNKRELARQQTLIDAFGLTPDDSTPTVHGVVEGYSVIATSGGDSMGTYDENYWSLIFSVKKRGTNEALDKEDFKPLRKESKAIPAIVAQGNRLVVSVNGAIKKDAQQDNLVAAMTDTVRYLQANGYENSCENGHTGTSVSNTVIAGVYRNYCDDCYAQVAGDIHEAHQSEVARKDNVFTAVIGAIIGSLIGGAAIILFYKLGFVAAISGFIMAIATIKGYTLMGGKIDIKAIVIIAVVMILMTYLANRITWAWDIADYFKVPFMEAFKYVHDAVEPSAYAKDIGLLYLFVGLGAVPTLISALKATPAVEVTYKMD